MVNKVNILPFHASDFLDWPMHPGKQSFLTQNCFGGRAASLLAPALNPHPSTFSPPAPLPKRAGSVPACQTNVCKGFCIFKAYRAMRLARFEKWVWTNSCRAWHAGTLCKKDNTNRLQ